MGIIVPTILLATASILFQLYGLPFATRTATLLGYLNRDWPERNARVDEILASGQCRFLHPELMKGCEDMHYHNGYMYAGCLGSNVDLRTEWMPGMGYRFLEKERKLIGKTEEKVLDDVFVSWDLKTDEAIPLELRGFPPGEDLSFHGFDLNEISNDNLTFYVINHRISGDFIEKFWHTPGTKFMTHITSIPVPDKAAGGAPLANDVLSLPELDDKNAIYVTNDHRYAEGPLRKIEDLGQMPWGHVSYYDQEVGWKVVLDNVNTANGITGTKKVRPVNAEVLTTDLIKNTVYLSSCTAGQIYVLTREDSVAHPETRGTLTLDQKITFPHVIDNPSLSHPSQSSLLVAGHSVPLTLFPHMLGSWSDPTRPPASGVIARVNTKEIGSEFYGTDGAFTGEVAIENIWDDKFGRLANATSTAVYIEPSIEEEAEGESESEAAPAAPQQKKGDLYVTGLTTEGVLVCKNFI